MSTVISASRQNPISGDGGSRLNEGQRSSRIFRLTQRRPARLLDIIRTRYVRLPPKLKAPLIPLLAALPMSMRFGDTYQGVRQGIRRSESDADFTREVQESGLRQLVLRASLRSRHYSRLFAMTYGANFDPARFSFDQLSLLPTLAKQEIVDTPEDFLVADAGEYDIRTTSGSSGRPPAKVFLDRDRSVGEMGFLHHLWSRIGYRLGDRRANP